MPHVFRVGYRRNPDGSATPVCDPPVDQFLLTLWARACTVVLDTEHYLVSGTVGGAIVFDGRMRPNDLVTEIGQMAAAGMTAMRDLDAAIRAGYPFASIADEVVARAGPRLMLCLDQPFVETETPAFAENGRVEVERARVEYDGGRVRVIVTGNAEDHPLRAWADALIRDRARNAILERLARGGGANLD